MMHDYNSEKLREAGYALHRASDLANKFIDQETREIIENTIVSELTLAAHLIGAKFNVELS